jgi:NAD(P)-dependent dehydrogenase (short-subunit alcohol dehydrogenase family)
LPRERFLIQREVRRGALAHERVGLARHRFLGRIVMTARLDKEAEERAEREEKDSAGARDASSAQAEGCKEFHGTDREASGGRRRPARQLDAEAPANARSSDRARRERRTRSARDLFRRSRRRGVWIRRAAPDNADTPADDSPPPTIMTTTEIAPHAHALEPEETDARPAAPPRIRGVPLEKRRAIVVGASSGIGAALVKRLVGEGYRVAALARRADVLESLRTDCAKSAKESGGELFVHAHDVHDLAAIPALFETIVRELGGLYLFVYAAGVMPEIGREEYDTEKDVEMIAVNLSGCVAWCNAAANYAHSQRDGTIVGVSSIAGDRGRKGNPVYCTTKAAMNTYLEALRNRLAEWGVHVCTIKPGFIDTAMTQGKPGLFWLISADDCARNILSAARGRANERYVPRRWWFVGTIIRSIPSFLFRHLNV